MHYTSPNTDKACCSNPPARTDNGTISSLSSRVSSNYIEAMQKLRGHKHRRKIVAYVESYDDVFFWRSLLSELETKDTYFEVMLPSRTSLQKGKKSALLSALSQGLGPSMIACVDADYDYVLDGSTPTSHLLLTSPYIFHTYAYAIENFQCYAPSLHNVCVMATLNDDRSVFDFEAFLAEYSRIVWPLFVWNIWAYRYGRYKNFSMADFIAIVSLKDVNLFNPVPALNLLSIKVNKAIEVMHEQFPEARSTYKPLMARLLELGLTPETTYLFMRGHDIFEKVAGPLVEHTCAILRKRREKEINSLAIHQTQKQNELAGYQHSSAAPAQMLKKQTDYHRSPLYQRIQEDVRLALKQAPKTLKQGPTPQKQDLPNPTANS